MSKIHDAGVDEADLSPEVRQFYGNRRLLWRNLFWLMVLTGGWNVVFMVINPLMTLRMNSPEIGMGEGLIAMIGSINGYAMSFLVMYFSWKSDHTVSRWGRRVPYLWITAPGIVLAVILFPFIHDKWILLGVVVLQLFFIGWKESTVAILGIDLAPRHMLARAIWIVGLLPSVIGFFALRYGMNVSETSEWIPFMIGAVVLTVTALTAGSFIREPPIRKPQTETFKPWSALKIGWKDRRRIWLMLGISMMFSSNAMYVGWIWLFSKNVLHLSRSEMGDALSWVGLIGAPLGFAYAWLIDRFNLYKLAGIYLLTQVVMVYFAIYHVHDKNSLIALSFIQMFGDGLLTAGSMILWRSMPPQDVGSFTAAAAFVKNAYLATLVATSGQLIERLGKNYYAAFILGVGMTSVGYGLLLVYRRLMATPAVQRGPVLEAIAPEPLSSTGPS